MERILEREYLRATRYKTDLSLIFLDLDDFKTINDTAGHDVGDQALRLVADTLTRLKRDSDIVARFAGDEFVVILPSTDKSETEYYIKRVEAYLDSYPMTHENDRFFIKMSHGISAVSDLGIKDHHSLLKAADQLLYLEKAKKKSR